MMVKYIYITIAFFIFVLGLLSNFLPDFVKKIVNQILVKNLFFIPGVLEIIVSLIKRILRRLCLGVEEESKKTLGFHYTLEKCIFSI